MPDKTWPTQLEETKAGYRLLCDYMGAGSRICVSGDSAGATLVMSLLLANRTAMEDPQRPGLALLVSPWTHLVSGLNRNTASDYLDSNSLHRYARQYAGEASTEDNVISPGKSESLAWRVAAPTRGYSVIYGTEEVFAPGIEETVRSMKRSGSLVESAREEAGIHVWPMVNLYLGGTTEIRLRGLALMAEIAFSKMGIKTE